MKTFDEWYLKNNHGLSEYSEQAIQRNRECKRAYEAAQAELKQEIEKLRYCLAKICADLLIFNGSVPKEYQDTLTQTGNHKTWKEIIQSSIRI